MHLTVNAVRRLLLAAQGLSYSPQRNATKADVLACIRRMGVLQIDSISVVARSPYFVLWSRLGTYEPVWLEELLAEGELFEYWSHAACFVPVDAYRLYRRDMLEGHPRARAWLAEHPGAAAHVLARLEHGPVRSADFQRMDGRAAGWWDWKPEKQALESLFSTGRVAIRRRDPNFHRVYELHERVFPQWDDGQLPSPRQIAEELTLLAVRALGAPRAGWVSDYFRTPKRGMASLLDDLVAEGRLDWAEVDGWQERVYIHPDHRSAAEDAARGNLVAEAITLLSPFDPIVWHRARALELFDFEYRIETYTPAAKRRFGYFSLPILYRDELVGRLDAKAHRAQGRFEVRALHLEPGVVRTDALVTALAGTLRACAQWHRTPEVSMVQSDPPDLAIELRRVL